MTVILALTVVAVSIAAASRSERDNAAPPAWLHVAGNRLIDSAGRPVLLHGVNRSGAEYSCVQNDGIFDGPSNAASVRAMAAWHINAVRLPLNEDCWLNVDTKGLNRSYVGAPYRRAIIRYVRLLNRFGMVVLLNLHWNAPGKLRALGQQPMPDADHSPAFWRSAAWTFRDNPYVAFDLYDEPYPDDDRDTRAAWICWRYGGQGHEAGSQKSCPGVTYYDSQSRDTRIPYRAASMESLIKAVRSTGARQLLIADGVQYADSLSGWLAYHLVDPLHNLAASWHPYNFNTCGDNPRCWKRFVAPVARRVPLIAGEFGEDDCTGHYVDRLLHWLDQHRASYLAWTWDNWYGPRCRPNLGPNGDISVISSYNGTPYVGMGVAYKRHLACLAARRSCGSGGTQS